MLNPVNSLTLVKLAFDVAKVLSETRGANFIDKPNVFVVLNLINEPGDRLYSRMLVFIDAVASDEIFVTFAVRSFFDF